MFDEAEKTTLPNDLTAYVALPVRERREIVQHALINARHLPVLRSLRLEYWFIGDRRGRQPILRRTAGAIDQHGHRHSVNLALHRLIATAVRLGKMPPDMQSLYNEMEKTPPATLRDLFASNGMFDYRDSNILMTNQQHHRQRNLIGVYKDTYQAKSTNIASAALPMTPDDLRREALESLGMSEDEFSLLAKPGDELADLVAKKEAQGDGKSLMDEIREKTLKGQREQEEAERKKAEGK